ncbi:endonuclease/exonuclease/phosphatase family protein [Kordia sp. SMS9]|uniref:endonuclease/exonuclease/phosphatase family protein n=1 Tax=Kordia sp. SMS9 TaxID=2282170 RepID=UPI000E107F5F|nr:endonuclease/exonuclease/phosphatase family protein [Kordia sp. SMS9]AXG70719.1 endonuclease/exonuclease/phosphatase family protein [Kordia sp. SMS9]
MKKFWALLSIILCITSCEDFAILEKDGEAIVFSQNIVTSPTYNGNLRAATFNMKLGFCQQCDPFSGDLGGDHEHLDKIVTLINDMNLDIITLQEVGYKYDTSIVENQLQYIADRVQMNYAYGMGRALQTGNNLFLRGFIGNAVLSKYEIVSTENHPIRYIDYYNQNHALKTTIKLSDQQEIIVVSTHFESGSTSDEKIIQFNELIAVTKNETPPVIIGADFNIPYTENNSFLSALTTDFSNSLEAIPTSQQSSILNTGTFITGATLDYIYTSKNDFTIETAFLVPEIYRNISDHFMYILEIQIVN